MKAKEIMRLIDDLHDDIKRLEYFKSNQSKIDGTKYQHKVDIKFEATFKNSAFTVYVNKYIYRLQESFIQVHVLSEMKKRLKELYIELKLLENER